MAGAWGRFRRAAASGKIAYTDVSMPFSLVSSCRCNYPREHRPEGLPRDRGTNDCPSRVPRVHLWPHGPEQAVGGECCGGPRHLSTGCSATR